LRGLLCFYGFTMKETIPEEEMRAILESMDHALVKGPWEATNFLRVIGKNLQGIRDELAEEIEKQYVTTGTAAKKKEVLFQPRDDQKEVFIALYSSEGSQLYAWERILANLQRQIVSRPIYEYESGVQTIIKSKENRLNEAYVAVYIDIADILKLSTDKIAKDKFGHQLMALKDRAIHLENITRFVHASGTYHYSKGHLHKVLTPGS
jgi:intracellular multiplication protein IcmQ